MGFFELYKRLVGSSDWPTYGTGFSWGDEQIAREAVPQPGGVCSHRLDDELGDLPGGVGGVSDFEVQGVLLLVAGCDGPDAVFILIQV
ncbi:hypothetical protein [Nonomuraea sp. NPDC049695]|uniref:hypothetical protein n=1 Tax=Nonomuraea sp. NPDC049695 TaxID=3154734 RepID=UPI003432906C